MSTFAAASSEALSRRTWGIEKAPQGTQDIGHHEFVYGIAGHAADWRHAETDWQAQRLNDPLIAFEAPKHAGALGREFSLLKVSNLRIRVLALKKAELSDEVIVRLVELDGKPQAKVRVSFAGRIAAAREVNGQEQPVGSAAVDDGALVTSFSAYQPRTFAVKLAPSKTTVARVRSAPVVLQYDLAAATNDGAPSSVGFDGKGNALPAEMLPALITFNNVQFQLAPAKTGEPDAVVAKGQTVQLPAGQYHRAYVLAASVDGDQEATFEVGGAKVNLNVQDWGGFIGQWDDRQWSSKDTLNDNYGEMLGINPGYIKRADLAWYSSHHHNAKGQNVSYGYSYLFAYPIDLPTGTKTIKLPDNNKVRILAISVAEENPVVKPAQPLYDVLPAPMTGASDFVLSTTATSVSFTQGRSGSTTISVLPRSGFNEKVALTASGLSAGVTATFSPSSTAGTSTMTLTANSSTKPATSTVTITGVSGALSHAATIGLTVRGIKTGRVPVDLSSAFNVIGIYTDGSTFGHAGLDGEGFAFSGKLLGATQEWDGALFKIGPANAPDAVTGQTISLPAGKFASLDMLATGVDGSQESQVFTVTYADGTTTSFTQSLSDWYVSNSFSGESVAVNMPYRLAGNGSKEDRPFHIYGYSFALDSSKVVSSFTLPVQREVLVFAVSLAPASSPAP